MKLDFWTNDWALFHSRWRGGGRHGGKLNGQALKKEEHKQCHA